MGVRERPKRRGVPVGGMLCVIPCPTHERGRYDVIWVKRALYLVQRHLQGVVHLDDFLQLKGGWGG